MANTYLENIMQNDFRNKDSSDIMDGSDTSASNKSTELSTSTHKKTKSVRDFTETSLSGGYDEIDTNITQRPTGGFPPIFKCVREEIVKEEEKKDRGYATKTTAVSIKEIMQHRRDETPFSL